MGLRFDILIEDAQLLTIGQQILLSVSFSEADGTAFSISSVEVDIYDNSEATVDSTLTGIAGSVESDGTTTTVLLTTAMTNLLEPGTYIAVWRLTLSDTQTRAGRQSLRVRSIP